jgi:hypothetical protein
MTALNSSAAARLATSGLGPVSKTLALSAATLAAFNIAGGEVLITNLWVKITVSSTTDGGTIAVNNVPTAGNTATIVTATDIGTTDSVAGTVIGLDRGTTAASKFLIGGRTDLEAVVTTGVVNLVGASAVNGTATISCLWVPLTTGATLVAA